MRFSHSLVIALLLSISGIASRAQDAQKPAEKPGVANPVAVIDDKPIAALPYTPSLDVPSMDKSVDPCVDFYAYSCGGWMKANPIPADQAAWSVYGKMYNDNQRFLWGILDDLSRKSGGRTPTSKSWATTLPRAWTRPRWKNLASHR